MIGIINYGLGNISAFGNIYKKLGVDYKYISNSDDLAEVNKLILPGVGSFDCAMQCFNDSGLLGEINKLVLDEKMPVLGVCVGLQMMAQSSDEGVLDGLGWLDGTVVQFDSGLLPAGYPLPHMGWNTLEIVREDPLLAGLIESKFYYLHSYYFDAANELDIIGVGTYGERFCCVVRSNNIYGIQCHPEKSHSYGIRFLKNFSEI